MGLFRSKPTCPNCGGHSFVLNEKGTVTYSDGRVDGRKVTLATERSASNWRTVACDDCRHILPENTPVWDQVVEIYQGG